MERCQFALMLKWKLLSGLFFLKQMVLVFSMSRTLSFEVCDDFPFSWLNAKLLEPVISVQLHILRSRFAVFTSSYDTHTHIYQYLTKSRIGEYICLNKIWPIRTYLRSFSSLRYFDCKCECPDHVTLIIIYVTCFYYLIIICNKQDGWLRHFERGNIFYSDY